MGNEPSAPTSAKEYRGTLHSTHDNGSSWGPPRMFSLVNGVLESQDKVETYTVSNTLVSNKKGVIRIALGMKTLVMLRVPPGSLSSEDDAAATWFQRLKAAAKQRANYNSTDLNPLGADKLVLLACVVFNMASGLIAAEYKAAAITPEQTEVLEQRKQYAPDQGPHSVMNILKKLVNSSEPSQEIVGTLELGQGLAFRYMLHKKKRMLVIASWQQAAAAGTDHVDGQAAMELLDPRGTQIIGKLAEPVIKQVFDHDQQPDNLPTPPRPPLSLGWCSSEQLGSFIAAEEAKVAKSGAVTKKLDLKIDQLNHVVADKLIPLAGARAEQIHANLHEAGTLEKSSHKFRESAGEVKKEKQWENCKYNLIVATVVFLVLAVGAAFLYYLLK